MAMEMVLRRMKVEGVTVHGFRSTFRDWCGEATSFPREIAEAALAHVAGDATERAYRRGDALEKRRTLMEAWAAFCELGERPCGFDETPCQLNFIMTRNQRNCAKKSPSGPITVASGEEGRKNSFRRLGGLVRAGDLQSIFEMTRTGTPLSSCEHYRPYSMCRSGPQQLGPWKW